MNAGAPHSGSKVWEAPDRTISESGKYRRQVVANGDSHPSAAFHDRENRRSLRSRPRTADMQPILSTQSHGTHGILCQVST